MSKKAGILVLSLLLIFISVSTVNATTGNLKVDWLIEEGYVLGDSNGYRLNDNITRAETTKMVVEAGGFGEQIGMFKNLTSMFNDISKTNWANGYVNVAVINSLVNGYPNGSFGPNNNITYAEVIKMLVMVNGDIPDTDLYEGYLWAVPYIAKADEVGITEDVNIANYNEKATREKVFELVYNTMFEEEIVQEEFEEEYNGIVIANKRVAGLEDTEIALVVFEDLDSTSDLPPRYEKDDEVIVTLPKRIEDVEYILGKVVDITIDNNNIVTDVKIDSSYSYLEGPILASVDEVYLGTNGEYYDVYLEDSSSRRIDRVFAVYHNDRSYDYTRYIDSLGESDSDRNIVFLAEYARLTVKKGKTYFIDSYTFSDIAPVSRVGRNGSDIYIYDDGDTSEAKITIDDVVGYTYDWGLETLNKDDIEVDDIVHIYNRDSALVSKDAKNYGQFFEVFEYSGYYFAGIDDYNYQVRITTDRRPVYSINGIDYKTLYAEDSNNDLAIFEYLDIIYLLDINGHVQLIEIE